MIKKYNHADTTKKIIEYVHNNDVGEAIVVVSSFCCYLVKQGLMPNEVGEAHCKDYARMYKLYRSMKKGEIKCDDSLPEYKGDYTVNTTTKEATKCDDDSKVLGDEAYGI